MSLKDWIQLTFGLLNGLSFVLTFRPYRATWRPKLAGSCALLVAHPGIAVYFLATHQAFFLVNSVIMTSAGCYGLWGSLRMRRHERNALAVARAVREGYEAGFAKIAAQVRVDRGMVTGWEPPVDVYPPEG